MRNKKGFTLIELLVVIAIIGLLATLSVVALNNARQKSRDAKRVSDIKQVQTALELYFVDQNGYPVEAVAVSLGEAGQETLSSTNGFAAAAAGTTYMGQVPDDPGVATGYGAYSYLAAAAANYAITFGLEGPTGGLTCAAYTGSCCVAGPNGIICT